LYNVYKQLGRREPIRLFVYNLLHISNELLELVTDLGQIGWGSVDWIQLAQDRDRCLALVNTVMNLRVLAPRS
jgi:hypothetical protein